LDLDVSLTDGSNNSGSDSDVITSAVQNVTSTLLGNKGHKKAGGNKSSSHKGNATNPSAVVSVSTNLVGAVTGILGNATKSSKKTGGKSIIAKVVVGDSDSASDSNGDSNSDSDSSSAPN
jgi:hypothetical protein